MEGLNTPIIEKEPGNKESREKKIEEAEKNIKEIFEARLSGILEEISSNPYFEDLGRSI